MWSTPSLDGLDSRAVSSLTTARAGTHHFGMVSAVRAHTKPIYYGERQGRLTTPGLPGPSRSKT